MPGISFKYDLGKNSIKRDNLFFQSLNSIIHNSRYEQKILLKEDSYLLGYTKYSEYPIKVLENSKFWICLEGRIYSSDQTVINKELNDLMDNIFNNQAVETHKIVNWLLKTDGEFVIFALDKKTKDLAIINDALGRLPLYYYKNDQELIISRELRFILNLVEDNKFERMSIAQYLLFGYPLGKRTLLSNIYRLEPSTLIKLHNNSLEIKIDSLYTFNFEEKKYNNEDIAKNANELVSLFSEACKNRADLTNKNIISLSGGFDSRSVAACFHKNKIPFSAVTLLEHNKTNSSDVEIAEQLAKLFDIDWKTCILNPPQGKDLLTLIRIKSGLNSLGMSFILPFFDEIKQKYGSTITFFTGDGGDKLLPDLRPIKKLKDLDDLVSYIVLRNSIFTIHDVAAITEIQEREIINELRKNVSSYPEKRLDQKYVHFLIYERSFKWLVEGEDRNRFYFWSVTPFCSTPFFNYAMNCSDNNKSQYGLYREFLLKLSPSATMVNNATYGCSITSNKFKIIRFIMNVALRLPDLRKTVKRIKAKNGYKGNSNVIKCLREQINNCESICRYLSCTELANIVDYSTNYSKYEIDNLFTITSVIEETCCHGSTIQKYYD